MNIKHLSSHHKNCSSLHEEVKQLNLSHSDHRGSYVTMCEQMLALTETVAQLKDTVDKQQSQIIWLTELLEKNLPYQCSGDNNGYNSTSTPINDSEYEDRDSYSSSFSLNTDCKSEIIVPDEQNHFRGPNKSSLYGGSLPVLRSVSVSYSPEKSKLIGRPLPEDTPAGPVLCLNQDSSCLFELDNRYKRIQMTRWTELFKAERTGGLIGKLILLPESFHELIVRPVIVGYNKTSLQIRLKSSRCSYNKRVKYPIHLYMTVMFDFLNGYQDARKHKFVINGASANAEPNKFFFPLKNANINQIPIVQLQFLPV